MPRYSASPEDFPGSNLPAVYPCAVYDGDDEEVADCLLFDTDTGEVIRQINDVEGNPLLNAAKDRIEEKSEFRKLPFRIEAATPATPNGGAA